MTADNLDDLRRLPQPPHFPPHKETTMFAKWKARRAAKAAARVAAERRAANIREDDYLRRLRNSSRMLTGTTHSGHNCEDTLKPWEICGVLRREYERHIANATP